jgi:4-amino-4-deoxy-L-arabinose transferase-like glycosyltransferase
MKLVRALTSPALIAVVAFAIRLGGVCYGHTYEQPAAKHWTFGAEMGCIARSIVSGQGFASPYCLPTGQTVVLPRAAATALEPPIYPYLLAGVFKLFGTYTAASAFIAFTLNSLFAALTCVTVFLIARGIFGPTVAACAGWAWAFYPYSILYAIAGIWETSLSALLLSLLFLLTLRASHWDRPWASLGLGLLWSVAALTNTALLAFFPFSLGWIWYRRHRRGMRPSRVVTLVALGLVLGVTPWLIRNYAAFGQPFFIRDDLGMELHVGNQEGATGHDSWRYFPPGSPSEMDQYRSLGELAYMKEKQREALSFIARHPGAFVWVTLERVKRFWIGTWSGMRLFKLLPRPEQAQLAVSLSILILALGGLATAFRNHRPEALLFSALLFAHPLVYYVTHLWGPRYRHPLEPAMVVLAAYAFVSVVLWARELFLPRASELPGMTS